MSTLDARETTNGSGGMMRKLVRTLMVALLVLGWRTGEAQLATVTLPPELDRVLRDYERGWKAGDAAGLAALFTEDGFVLQPNRPPVRGRTAIQAAYTGASGGDLRLRALAYAVDGNVGYLIGAYGYGDAPGDVGKFTLTLRRAGDGRWLIMSDMDNGNAPPRRPATTPP